VGEQVVVLAPSGDLAAAVALPGIFQVAAPPPSDEETRAVIEFSDGAVISYDVEAHVLRAELPAGGKLDVVGAIEASGDVEDGASTMQEMRDVFNAHTHAVVNNATTAPNPKM
ncbi:MAG: phage baseplate assembly protein V, partial [Acidobacteria bacterium]|nr:phage baseplate assembly protein V [Acidobacteriota bacterium]